MPIIVEWCNILSMKSEFCFFKNQDEISIIETMFLCCNCFLLTQVGGNHMGIIEQTNRTILFDVVNPEVFNMFNIMSDVDENSRSLTDEKVA